MEGDGRVQPDGSDDQDALAAPPAAGHRTWRHPSEVGLQGRQRADRSRGFHMVVVMVVLAALVLGVTAVISRSTDSRPQGNPEPFEAATGYALATVEVDTGGATREEVAVIVDHGRHAVTLSSADGPAAESEGERLEDADDIVVTLGDDTTGATVVATDDVSGMVLLGLDQPMGSNPGFGEEMSVGEQVELVHRDGTGRIHGEPMTITDVDSEVLRADDSLATNLLALDGHVQSYGPLTDPSGALGGWVFGVDGNHSVAYKAETIRELVAQMLTTGTSHHGWMGVRAATSTDDMAGAVVLDVKTGSPAATAGIQDGDLIVSLGDARIQSLGDLVDQLDTTDIGSTVTIGLYRGEEQHSVPVTVGDFPS